MVQPLIFSKRRGVEMEFASIGPPALLRVPLTPQQASRVRPAGTGVAAGGPICDAGQDGLAPVPAPASGVIGALAGTMLLGGGAAAAVELHVSANGAAGATEPARSSAVSDLDPTLEPWIARLAAAGVNSLRVNSPDLLAQLSACIEQPADTLILSLFDVEAHLPLSAALLASEAAELVAATSLLASLCGAQRSLVVVGPGTRAKALGLFEPLVRGGKVRLVEVTADYPLADPTLLLHTLTQRRLPPGALPTERRVLLLDAAAAVAVGRLALRGQPMLTVPLAVRDHVARASYLLWAPVGMSVDDLCRLLEVPCRSAQLRAGELLRQREASADAVVGAGEVTLHIGAVERPIVPDPCIRCGWCVDACPTGVHPAYVLEAAQRSDRALAEAYGLEACIGCGICTYVCPSRLPLLRAVRTFAAV